MEFEGKVPFTAPSIPSLWSSPSLSVAMFYGLLTVANSLQVDMKIIAPGQEIMALTHIIKLAFSK